MPKTREQKSETIERLTEAFKKGKSAMFADGQGMTVAKMTALRKKLHASQADYIVAKKSLMALAAKEAGYQIDFKSLPGMLGAAFAYEDEMAAAKIIGEAGGKDAPIKLVGGLFDGKAIDQTYALALSKLPNKSQLLGQLLSVMNGPMSAFVRLLNAYKESQDTTSASAPEAPAPVVIEAPAQA